MAQSGVSNAKKGVIPNFKLDLSKCKNDEGEDFVVDGEEFEDFIQELQMTECDHQLQTQDAAIDFKALEKNDDTIDLDHIVLIDP